jgi:putative transposase
LADQRRRFGYRRLHVLLRGEGWIMNRKKTQRLYGKEGLAVRRRKSRRRIAVARTPIPKPEGPNSRGSTDFVHDQLANGRRFRVLTIIDDVPDDVPRECLAAVPDTSLSGKRVVREMSALIARRRKPGAIVSDNGTEFTSSAVLAERLRRELPGKDAGRMPQRAPVLLDEPTPARSSPEGSMTSIPRGRTRRSAS